jgi:hypothetical protein
LKLKLILSAGALLIALAACGPADVDTAANEGAATAAALVPEDVGTTAEALASDPTVEAAANEAAATVEAALSDPAVQMALDEAFRSVNDRVTLTQGQALTFDALDSLSDIQNYKMTILDAPAGAEASENKVIKEASGGNVSLDPSEYEQYFTTAGDYKVRLDITSSGNATASHEFTITVP